MLGSILVFKDGTSPEEAQAAIDRIKDVLAPYWLDPEDSSKRVAARIEEFDPAYGGPVWYVP